MSDILPRTRIYSYGIDVAPPSKTEPTPEDLAEHTPQGVQPTPPAQPPQPVAAGSPPPAPGPAPPTGQLPPSQPQQRDVNAPPPPAPGPAPSAEDLAARTPQGAQPSPELPAPQPDEGQGWGAWAAAGVKGGYPAGGYQPPDTQQGANTQATKDSGFTVDEGTSSFTSGDPHNRDEFVRQLSQNKPEDIINNFRHGDDIDSYTDALTIARDRQNAADSANSALTLAQKGDWQGATQKALAQVQTNFSNAGGDIWSLSKGVAKLTHLQHDWQNIKNLLAPVPQAASAFSDAFGSYSTDAMRQRLNQQAQQGQLQPDQLQQKLANVDQIDQLRKQRADLDVALSQSEGGVDPNLVQQATDLDTKIQALTWATDGDQARASTQKGIQELVQGGFLGSEDIKHGIAQLGVTLQNMPERYLGAPVGRLRTANRDQLKFMLEDAGDYRNAQSKLGAAEGTQETQDAQNAVSQALGQGPGMTVPELAKLKLAPDPTKVRGVAAVTEALPWLVQPELGFEDSLAQGILRAGAGSIETATKISKALLENPLVRKFDPFHNLNNPYAWMEVIRNPNAIGNFITSHPGWLLGAGTVYGAGKLLNLVGPLAAGVVKDAAAESFAGDGLLASLARRTLYSGAEGVAHSVVPAALTTQDPEQFGQALGLGAGLHMTLQAPRTAGLSLLGEYVDPLVSVPKKSAPDLTNPVRDIDYGTSPAWDSSSAAHAGTLDSSQYALYTRTKRVMNASTEIYLANQPEQILAQAEMQRRGALAPGPLFSSEGFSVFRDPTTGKMVSFVDPAKFNDVFLHEGVGHPAFWLLSDPAARAAVVNQLKRAVNMGDFTNAYAKKAGMPGLDYDSLPTLDDVNSGRAAPGPNGWTKDYMDNEMAVDQFGSFFKGKTVDELFNTANAKGANLPNAWRQRMGFYLGKAAEALGLPSTTLDGKTAMGFAPSITTGLMMDGFLSKLIRGEVGTGTTKGPGMGPSMIPAPTGVAPVSDIRPRWQVPLIPVAGPVTKAAAAGATEAEKQPQGGGYIAPPEPGEQPSGGGYTAPTEPGAAAPAVAAGGKPAPGVTTAPTIESVLAEVKGGKAAPVQPQKTVEQTLPVQPQHPAVSAQQGSDALQAKPNAKPPPAAKAPDQNVGSAGNQATTGGDYSDTVANQVGSMPSGGTYSTDRQAFHQLGAAITKDAQGNLHVDTSHINKGFCSGASYLNFCSTIENLQRAGKIQLDPKTVDALRVAGQQDGQGVWGRFNANGPGVARLFAETGMGENFTDINKAKPGDYLKIFWNGNIGASEHGHAVVYMGRAPNGDIKYWSANQKGGYSIAQVSPDKVNGMMFSRLTHPENINNVLKIPDTDSYLSSLTSKDSNNAEMAKMTGSDRGTQTSTDPTSVGRNIVGENKIRGTATNFARNLDGTIDKDDNGIGFFDGVNTRDPDLKGVAVPIDILERKFGKFTQLQPDRTYAKLDTPEARAAIAAIKASHVAVDGPDGKVHNYPIVDIQGSERFHPGHVLDLTYGAAKDLGLKDNAQLSYQIIGGDGKAIDVSDLALHGGGEGEGGGAGGEGKGKGKGGGLPGLVTTGAPSPLPSAAAPGGLQFAPGGGETAGGGAAGGWYETHGGSAAVPESAGVGAPAGAGEAAPPAPSRGAAMPGPIQVSPIPTGGVPAPAPVPIAAMAPQGGGMAGPPPAPGMPSPYGAGLMPTPAGGRGKLPSAGQLYRPGLTPRKKVGPPEAPAPTPAQPAPKPPPAQAPARPAAAGPAGVTPAGAVAAGPAARAQALGTLLNQAKTATTFANRKLANSRAQDFHTEQMLDPDDQRVRKQADGRFKGQHFIMGDPMHEHMLAETTDHDKAVLGAGQSAMANKRPMHITYSSAAKKGLGDISRTSRATEYQMAGETGERQLSGHTLIPVSVGIAHAKKQGEPHSGYIEGISADVAANNHGHINEALQRLGQPSPYPHLDEHFAHDLHGYVSNLAAGYRGTGEGPAAGTAEFPARIDRNHVPHQLSPEQGHFLNAVLHNVQAKSEGRPDIRELAGAGHTLLTPKGETNPIRRDMEAREPGWIDQRLEPTVRTFTGSKVHEIHERPEDMPEGIREGVRHLGEAIQRFPPLKQAAPQIAAGFVPAAQLNRNRVINQIERDFAEGKHGEEEAQHRLAALGENPANYRFVAGHGLVSPHEENPEALTPEEHSELVNNLRQQWISGKLKTADFKERMAEIPLPEKPAFMPMAGPGARGFARAKAAGKTFKSPLDMEGPERFEISDRDMKFRPAPPDSEYINRLEDQYHTKWGDPMKLSAALDHPELFRNYPHLKNTNIQYDPTIKADGFFEHPWSDDQGKERGNTIVLKNAEDKETLAHEIQHAVQFHENFPGGTNPQDLYHDLRADPAVLSEVRKTASAITANPAQRDKLVEHRLKAIALATYMHEPGELEARAAGERAVQPPGWQVPPEESLRYVRQRAEENYPEGMPGVRPPIEGAAFMLARGGGLTKDEFKAAPEDIRQAHLEEKVKGQLANQSTHPSAIPIQVQRNAQGGVQYDPDGKPVYKKVDYDIANSPLLGKKGLDQLDNADEHPDEIDEDQHTHLNATERNRLSALRKTSAVDTMADRIVQSYHSVSGVPEIAAGKGWYSKMRKRLKQVFGDDNEIFAQLLGATSAKTPVRNNFIQALDAYEQYKAGKAGQTEEQWKQGLKDGSNHHLGFNKHIAKYLEAYDKMQEGEGALGAHMDSLGIAKPIDDDGTEQTEYKSDSDALAHWVRQHGILPLQQHGAKYNQNSNAVLKVLAQKWLEDVGAPKTPNFAGNLTGRTKEATIDVWAARHLRRLGYEGQTKEPWRIQPSSDAGVSGLDFAFSQDAMRKAADKISQQTGKKLNPDDLQAILWYAEKHHYEQQGWTRGQGAAKSSFDEVFDKVFPKSGEPMTAAEARNHYQAVSEAESSVRAKTKRLRDMVAKYQDQGKDVDAYLEKHKDFLKENKLSREDILGGGGEEEGEEEAA